ncbi:putative immunoglobulin-like domain containing protein [Namao virus]|nr:putative immunoglobulin-like domain containing protein [Namao virus]
MLVPIFFACFAICHANSGTYTHSDSLIEAEEGEDVILECGGKYINSNISQLDWEFETTIAYQIHNKTIQCFVNRFCINAPLNSSFNYITIKNVTEADTKIYTCTIKRKVGDTLDIDRYKITLNVSKPVFTCQAVADFIIVADCFDYGIIHMAKSITRKFLASDVNTIFYQISNTSILPSLSSTTNYDILTGKKRNSVPLICLVFSMSKNEYSFCNDAEIFTVGLNRSAPNTNRTYSYNTTYDNNTLTTQIAKDICIFVQEYERLSHRMFYIIFVLVSILLIIILIFILYRTCKNHVSYLRFCIRNKLNVKWQSLETISSLYIDD